MLRNCFFDFAVEHWFVCRATEPGFAGDIGDIEIWLIDRLICIYKWHADHCYQYAFIAGNLKVFIRTTSLWWWRIINLSESNDVIIETVPKTVTPRYQSKLYPCWITKHLFYHASSSLYDGISLPERNLPPSKGPHPCTDHKLDVKLTSLNVIETIYENLPWAVTE